MPSMSYVYSINSGITKFWPGSTKWKTSFKLNKINIGFRIMNNFHSIRCKNTKKNN